MKLNVLVITQCSTPHEAKLLGYPANTRFQYFLQYLGRKHRIVELLDDSLPQPYRISSGIRNFSPNISKWYTQIIRNTTSFVLKSQASEEKIRNLNYEIDLVLQIGCLSSPYISRILKPYYLYLDTTTKVAEREHPNWMPWRSTKQRNQWIMLEKMTYLHARKIFVMSEYAKKFLISDYGIDKAKIIVVYAGANMKEIPDYQKNYDAKIILFVGKSFFRKGGYTILRAFRKVRKHVEDTKLVIVGCKPNISDSNVVIEGVLKREELLSLYRSASIFVMPSFYEPFGLVFLEAMAHKLPCIGSTRDAMPEIIEDNQTGFLIPPDDHEALASKLIFLLHNKDVMENMGKKGWARVKETFNWREVVSRITEEFEKDFV